MTERKPIGTWFYTSEAGGTFFLYQENDPEPTIAAVVFSQTTADYFCEKLNEPPRLNGEVGQCR